MPNLRITGNRIGVQIRIIGAMSMKVPRAISRMLIIISSSYLLLATLTKKWVALAGTCISAIM